jgi:hypothetical protein
VKAPLTLVKINLFSIIFKAEVDLDNWLDSMWNLLSLNSVSMPFLFECHHSKCVYINRWIENKLNVVVLIVILGVVVPSVVLNVVVTTVVVLNVVMLNVVVLIVVVLNAVVLIVILGVVVPSAVMLNVVVLIVAVLNVVVANAK